MNWFFIALFAPALWSIGNHLDKYLISKYFKGGGTGALIIFSSLIGLFVLPFILIFKLNVLEIQLNHALLIMGSSIVSLIAILIYLYVLKRDEASIVVPLFQTIPVFSYILAHYLLGENLTNRQIFGSLLVILGSVGISLDLTSNIPKLKTVVFLLMAISSFLIALSGLIFKFVAIQADFWTTSFWGYLGDTLVGIFFLVFIRSYRDQFVSVIKLNELPIIGLNGLNEVINVIASLCLKFASLLAPLALVWVVNGFQPFFVFLYGLILTIFFPKLGTESLLKKHLAQKIIAILIIFLGSFILNG